MNKVVVYTDGSSIIISKGTTAEYENDRNWLTTIDVPESISNHTSEPVRSAEEILSKQPCVYGNCVIFEDAVKAMEEYTDQFRQSHPLPTSQIEAKALEITEEELLDKYIEKSGYGMDMWSPDENYAVSTILDILFPPNPTK